MRLTPFRNRSSDSEGDESTIRAATSVNMLELDDESAIGPGRVRTGSEQRTSAGNWDVVGVLENRPGRMTVDEVADELYEPTGANDVEGWADVHERLIQEELPELDASGVVDFDPDRGTVALAEEPDRSSTTDRFKQGTLVALSLGLLVTGLVQAAPMIVSALSLVVAGFGIALAVTAY